MFFLKKPNFTAFKFLFLLLKGQVVKNSPPLRLHHATYDSYSVLTAPSGFYLQFLRQKKFDILCNYRPNVKVNEPCLVCKLLQSTPNPQPNQPTPAYIRNKEKPRQTDFLPGNLQSLAGLTINTVIVSHNPWYASKNSLPLPLFCRILGAFSVMK